MTFSVVLLMLSTQIPVFTDDLMPDVSNEFALIYRRESNHSLLFQRASDQSSMIARINFTPLDVDVAWKRLTSVSNYEVERSKPATPPSGLRMADRATSLVSKFGVSTYAMLDSVVVTIKIAYSGTGPRGNVTWNNSDPEGDKVLVEGLARNGLAKTFGRRLSPAPNQVVNGIAITNCKRNSDGVIMVPLGQWAAARGISLSQNERLGTFSFTFSGRAYIVPLAAKQIKAGGSWEDLAAPVLKANDSAYVPLSSMRNILG